MYGCGFAIVSMRLSLRRFVWFLFLYEVLCGLTDVLASPVFWEESKIGPFSICHHTEFSPVTEDKSIQPEKSSKWHWGALEVWHRGSGSTEGGTS